MFFFLAVTAVTTKRVFLVLPVTLVPIVGGHIHALVLMAVASRKIFSSSRRLYHSSVSLKQLNDAPRFVVLVFLSPRRVQYPCVCVSPPIFVCFLPFFLPFHAVP